MVFYNLILSDGFDRLLKLLYKNVFLFLWPDWNTWVPFLVNDAGLSLVLVLVYIVFPNKTEILLVRKKGRINI
jgi:hypothetical protein